LQGSAEQALSVVEHNIEEGNAVGQALSFCSVLGQGACPIALWAGDLDAAERYGAMLLDPYRAPPDPAVARLGRLFQRPGDGQARRPSPASPRHAANSPHSSRKRGRSLASPACSSPRRRTSIPLAMVAPGLAIVEEMLARCEVRDELRYLAELLRIKGALVLLEGAPDAAGAAEGHFRRALECTHRQGALSWELRAATSLARLWRDQHHVVEARDGPAKSEGPVGAIGRPKIGRRAG
jgi:hypothetical protein